MTVRLSIISDTAGGSGASGSSAGPLAERIAALEDAVAAFSSRLLVVEQATDAAASAVESLRADVVAIRGQSTATIESLSAAQQTDRTTLTAARLDIREHLPVRWKAGNDRRRVTTVQAGVEYDWTCYDLAAGDRQINPNTADPGVWRLDTYGATVLYVPFVVPHLRPGMRIAAKGRAELEFLGGTPNPNKLPVADGTTWKTPS